MDDGRRPPERDRSDRDDELWTEALSSARLVASIVAVIAILAQFA